MPFFRKIFSHILEGTTAVPRTSYQLAIYLPDNTLMGTCGVRLEDIRARTLAEHLGMQLEGILRETQFFRGEWWDTAVYSILKNEWS